MRALGCISLAIAVWAALTIACWAEDSDRLRFYLGLRGQDTNKLTGVHDLYGFSLGANLNRYFGVELSGDRFERFLKVSPYGTIGEYALAVSMVRRRACACTLRTKATCNTRGNSMSPTYRPRPVTRWPSSLRGMGAPKGSGGRRPPLTIKLLDSAYQLPANISCQEGKQIPYESSLPTVGRDGRPGQQRNDLLHPSVLLLSAVRLRWS